MKRVHYTMPARSQGKLHAQRATACLAKKDAHRWVFAHNLTPDVECTVRKWLSQRLNGFYCDLHDAYMSHVAGPEQARTHIVLRFPPPPIARGERDEIVPVCLQGAEARAAVKEIIKATGLNPHLSVYGWPFCLDDLGGVDDMEGEMI